ncbi:MAG: transglycosylase domain-containing protein [Candidatus Yanofskybacteria bacterium]|nr:transglycosylase domain-containing protein [Candidatus Yanofskybacteria bacterium]
MPLVLLTHIGLIAYYVVYDRNNMPDINILIKFEPPAIGTIYDEEGNTIMNLANEFRWTVKPEKIPLIIKQAVLSAEDKSFYNHNGVSLRDISRATWINTGHIIDGWIGGKGIDLTPSQGASTLDQQLARMVYLKEKTQLENSDQFIFDNYFTRLTVFILRDTPNINRGWRKIEEARLALWINEEFVKPEHFGSSQKAKEEILARYLNLAYFRYAYGVKAAAKFYFNKDLSDFDFNDADKAAFLAGVLKNPSLYAPRIGQKKDNTSLISLRQINRRNAILDQMVENEYLSEKQAIEFKERSIPIPIKDIRNLTDAPTVVTETFREIRLNNITTSKIYSGDLQIHTTINLKIQKIAQDACENGLAEYEKRHPEHSGQTQCSIIALRNENAAILAEVGGRKFHQNKEYLPGELNRVNRARQIGSAFKPFIYLTAFINGLEPNSKIVDSPVPISMGYGRGYHWVNNYDGKFLGEITLCEALYRSRNAPTVRLTMTLGSGSFENSGMKKVIDTTRMLGVKSPFHSDIDHLGRMVYYPTSALGASEMTLTELTNAYREIASGISVGSFIIQRVIGRNGEDVFEKSYNGKPSVIDPIALGKVRSCLRKVVTQPGGTAYSLTLSNFPVPVIGKTGTTDDFRNALFIGSTYGLNGITVGVEINFDDNTELGNGETGARTALPIFKEIMAKIYEQGLAKPAVEFPEYVELNPQ